MSKETIVKYEIKIIWNNGEEEEREVNNENLYSSKTSF